MRLKQFTHTQTHAYTHTHTHTHVVGTPGDYGGHLRKRSVTPTQGVHNP